EKGGGVVSKRDLLEAVGPDTRGSEVGLKDYVQEIRKALGDAPKAPRFIETVPRRGYRFIAPITTTPPMQNVKLKMQNGPSLQDPHTQHPAPTLVGREPQLEQLRQWSEMALT